MMDLSRASGHLVTWLLTSAGTAPGQIGDLRNVGVGKTVYREAEGRKSKKERSSGAYVSTSRVRILDSYLLPVRVEFLSDSGINGYEP